MKHFKDISLVSGWTFYFRICFTFNNAEFMKRTLDDKIAHCFSAWRFHWDNEKGERWYKVYLYFIHKKTLYHQVI